VWEEERRDMLVNFLTRIQLSTSIDEWKCHHVFGGMFSVRSIYLLFGRYYYTSDLFGAGLCERFGILVEEFCPVKKYCFLMANFTSPIAYYGKSC
jgi:hypothetical protein